MELLLHQWGDWPELYRNTDKTEATEIVIIDSQMNYRGKLDTYPFNYLFDMYTLYRYNVVMIKTFADKETEKIYNQQFSKKLPQSIQRIALRKLMMLDNAERLEDLRVPPANHLELLHGNRAGQYSIRINQQYRICFIFENGVSRNVEIVDYHS